MGVIENKKFPKILVVSNNPFSETSNNGKTLASFFEDYPASNIAQLYFENGIPNNSKFTNYFRITDIEVLNSVIKKREGCGSRVILNQENEKSILIAGEKTKAMPILKEFNFTRIVREIIWKREKWKSNLLEEWLNDFTPDIIFFCAGDSGFAYDIVKYIKNKYNTKLVTYITDDYILPRKNKSPFWWIRRNYIFNKMNETVKMSDLFLTISEKMREEYNKLFTKDSHLMINMSEPIGEIKEDDNKRNPDSITLIYAGGLHFKRYKTLKLLAEAIERFNHGGYGIKAFLRIYSAENPTKKILHSLNIIGASEFCGKLDSLQLKIELNKSDIPVHVESFDKKSIESTRLSISTKIPEYLSLNKPLLAIGPKNVASIEYLMNSAYCITNPANLSKELELFFTDSSLRKKIATTSNKKYEIFHNKEKNKKKFMELLLKI